MFNESDYPTLKYMRCKQCGNIFAARMDGSTECPDCMSDKTDVDEPGRNEGE